MPTRCRICRQKFPESELIFYKSGASYCCAPCVPAAAEIRNSKRRARYARNPELRAKNKLQHIKYRQNNRDKMNAAAKIYKAKNKDRVKAWNRKSLLKNWGKHALWRKAYYKKNRSACRAATDAWTIRNREYLAKYKRDYMRNRREMDLAFKMEQVIRARIYCALNRGKGRKSSRTIELLGCTGAELISYLENQFVAGMSWENYGPTGWHIDHILPCSCFDLLNPEHQRECFHFTNLQPMWSADNFKKSNHVTLDQIEELIT